MRSACVVIALAVAGCAASSFTPVPAPTPPAPSVSFDGTYQGSVALTGVGAGVPSVGCVTNPQVTLQVRNNAFTLSQAHPNDKGAGTAAETAETTTTYAVTIAPNGTFGGQSQVGGSVTGVISGTHMTGTIEGLVCVYSLTADRV
jgi:hypothetical protein